MNEKPDNTGVFVDLWKLNRVLDLLLEKGVRHFMTYYRDAKVFVAERRGGHIRVGVPYDRTEWQAVLDNLEQHEFASVYTDMSGGKLVLYVLPVRGLKLSDEVLEAIHS